MIERPPLAEDRRALVGRPPLHGGGLAMLACCARAHARQLGLGTALIYSRVSLSRYLHLFEDGRAESEPVIIRISDHSLARRGRWDFELISLDGRAGLDRLIAWVRLVAAGEVA